MIEITISESGCPLSDYFAQVNINGALLNLGLKFDDNSNIINVLVGEGSDAQDIYAIVENDFLLQLEESVQGFIYE